MRQQLTFDARTRLHAKMQELVTKTDDGMVKYKTGWNDHRLADELGVTVAQVQHHRQAQFGRLYAVVRGADLAVTQQDLEHLYARIEALEASIRSIAHFVRGGVTYGQTAYANGAASSTPNT